MKEKTFISSTFWTEGRSSSSFKNSRNNGENSVMEKNYRKRKKIMNFWNRIAKKNKIIVKVQGIPSLCNFQFKSHNHEFLKIS